MPKSAKKVVFFALATGGAAAAIVIVAGAMNGRLFADDWAIWSVPAWLFPALAAWGAFGGKGGCKTAKADGAPPEDGAAAPTKLRGEARREQRREARRQRRERRSSKRTS